MATVEERALKEAHAEYRRTATNAHRQWVEWFGLVAGAVALVGLNDFRLGGIPAWVGFLGLALGFGLLWDFANLRRWQSRWTSTIVVLQSLLAHRRKLTNRRAVHEYWWQYRRSNAAKTGLEYLKDSGFWKFNTMLVPIWVAFLFLTLPLVSSTAGAVNDFNSEEPADVTSTLSDPGGSEGNVVDESEGQSGSEDATSKAKDTLAVVAVLLLSFAGFVSAWWYLTVWRRFEVGAPRYFWLDRRFGSAAIAIRALHWLAIATATATAVVLVVAREALTDPPADWVETLVPYRVWVLVTAAVGFFVALNFFHYTKHGLREWRSISADDVWLLRMVGGPQPNEEHRTPEWLDRVYLHAGPTLYPRHRFRKAGPGQHHLLSVALFVPKECVAIDVGAEHGVFTRQMIARSRSSLFRRGRARAVIAYEPNPQAAEVLRRTLPRRIRRTGLPRQRSWSFIKPRAVIVREKAASSRNQRRTLRWPVFGSEAVSGFGSLGKRFDQLYVLTQRVPAVRLDTEEYTEYEKSGPKTRPLPDWDVLFIKIDVEGHELQVLQGARALLRQNKPNLLVEIEARHRDPRDVEPVLDYLRAMGYLGLFWCCPDIPELHLATSGPGRRKYDHCDAEGAWYPASEFRVRTNQRHELADTGSPAYVNDFFFVHRDKLDEFKAMTDEFGVSDEELRNIMTALGRTTTRKGPSTLLKAFFKVPVWMYEKRLGFLFFGRLIAIVHRGRKSGNRYVSGLEVLARRDGELFVLSMWGAKSDWYRNIEANGVDELWDRQKQSGASFRVVISDEAFGILSDYEKAHKQAARFGFPRIYPGYDFTDESRRALVDSGVIVAFTPS